MQKRILIFGAGAIGTYLGTRLALQQHQVIFLERKKDLPGLQQRGLRLIQGEQEYNTASPTYISSLEEIRGQKLDLAILALKTYHLERFIPELIHHREDLPPVLCLQNGVESEKLLTDSLGSDTVIPGTVTSAVDRMEKGSAVVQKDRGLGIAGNHPLARNLVEIFNQAGLKCQYFPDTDSMKWSKLITNLLGNASAAILNMPPAAIYAHPGLYNMERAQILEALKVMSVQHIRPVNLPGVPVKVLAAAFRFLSPALSHPLLSRVIGSGRGKKMPSFHIDLYSGRGSSEVDQLNGAVVRAGERSGVATPVNQFLTKRLIALMEERISLNRYDNKPALFLEDLHSYKSGREISE